MVVVRFGFILYMGGPWGVALQQLHRGNSLPPVEQAGIVAAILNYSRWMVEGR